MIGTRASLLLVPLLFGSACGVSKSDPTAALAECGDPDAIDESTLIAWDFKESAHEMLVCGQLSAQLQASLINGAATLLADPKSAPEAFTYADGAFIVEQDNVTMTVSLACGSLTIGCDEGEEVDADPFLADSYLVGATATEGDTGTLIIEFERPGPLVGLLGQGRNPSSPLRLNATDLGVFISNISRLRANTVVDFADQVEQTSVVYSLRTGRIDIQDIHDGKPMPFELKDASATRGEQTMTPITWEAEVLEHGVDGLIEMEVRGGEVEYLVRYLYTADVAEPEIEMECLDEALTDDSSAD